MIQRTAIRALVLADDAVLMIQGRVPDTGALLWMTPGGGIEPGESDEECLARELYEETGFRLNNWHGPVWVRRHQFLFMGENYDQTERFYLVRADRFEPTMQHNPAAHEVDGFMAFRWWQRDEIAASSDTFVPAGTAHHIDALLTNPLPSSPVDVSNA